jgi:hypothetical protein
MQDQIPEGWRRLDSDPRIMVTERSRMDRPSAREFLARIAAANESFRRQRVGVAGDGRGGIAMAAGRTDGGVRKPLNGQDLAS